jgi:hypothetical protein
VALSSLIACTGLQEAWHVYCQTVQAEQDAGLSATSESHQRQLAALQVN